MLSALLVLWFNVTWYRVIAHCSFYFHFSIIISENEFLKIYFWVHVDCLWMNYYSVLLIYFWWGWFCCWLFLDSYISCLLASYHISGEWIHECMLNVLACLFVPICFLLGFPCAIGVKFLNTSWKSVTTLSEFYKNIFFNLWYRYGFSI